MTLSNGVIAARIGNAEAWVVLGLATLIGLADLPLMLSKVNNVQSLPQVGITIFAFFLWVFAVYFQHLSSFTDKHSVAVAAGSLGLGLLTFFTLMVFKGSQ